MLKILRIEYKNIGIFGDNFAVDFIATDKVANEDQVFTIRKPVYTQHVMSIIGINATGKSTALRLINAAMDIVLGNKGLNTLKLSSGILLQGSEIIVVFSKDKEVYQLHSYIGLESEEQDDQNKDSPYIFTNEKIYKKSIISVTSKKKIFSFGDGSIIMDRSEDSSNEQFNFLKNTDSIVIAITKNDKVFYRDMINDANINIYRVSGDSNIDFINLFDDNIESLHNDDNGVVVCFNNKVQFNSSKLDAQNVISSGTIKGGNLLFLASVALKSGGYLIVDELENHFNKKLVETIIDLFDDPSINKFGACLIFSTHYVEVIDSIKRKDNIYLLRRKKNKKSTIDQYSGLIKRNDVKKSEIFLSNYIDGTAPSYEAIQRVRDYICQS